MNSLIKQLDTTITDWWWSNQESRLVNTIEQILACIMHRHRCELCPAPDFPARWSQGESKHVFTDEDCEHGLQACRWCELREAEDAFYS